MDSFLRSLSCSQTRRRRFPLIVYWMMGYCAVLLLSSCAGPLAGKQAGRASAAAQRAAARVSTPSSPPAGAVPRLVVNAESVEARELWAGLHLEVSRLKQERGRAAFLGFLGERAAKAINEKIAEMLIYQHAKLQLPDGAQAQVDRIVDDQIRRLVTARFDGVQRRYEKELEDSGQTLEAEHTRLARDIVIARFLELDLRPLIPEPTRAELEIAYRAMNDAQGQRPKPRKKMSLIDIRTVDRLAKENSSPTRQQSETARTEAKNRAELAHAEIKAGQPFPEVCVRFSDAANAQTGGDWGWVARESVRDRFLPAVEALDSLTPGETSMPIETPDGYFLVRCDQIETLEPLAPATFENAQSELRERHMRKMFDLRMAELVARLRDGARIEPQDLSRFHAAVVAAAP